MVDVKVSYSPVKELVVHEVIKMGFEDLMISRVTPSGTMPLFFCNNVLFSFASLPATKEVVNDYVQGKIHWMEVRYMAAESYQPVLELHDEQYIKSRVINTSDNPIHSSFVRWLKEWEKRNK